MLLFLLISCTPAEPTPESIVPLLEDSTALEQELQKITDPNQKDLLLLRTAVQSPKHAQMLCKKIQTPNAKEKCKQIVGRPHLGVQ
ncbi:MAG: hypothetical protein VX278_07540 [Myxococcota bacterium]|nr:hypothetical protein [Myxococcota bacterium]